MCKKGKRGKKVSKDKEEEQEGQGISNNDVRWCNKK